MNVKFAIVVVALTATLAFSCRGAETMDNTVLGQISETDVSQGLETLARVKVFFGHQSVGWNILDGLKDIGATAGSAAPRIVETRSAADISGPGFYHAGVGANTDPLSKLRDFEAVLRSGVGDAVDAACMKFCYIDIDANTDVDALFSAYRETMTRIQKDFPRLVLIHFTAPLVTDEGGLKASVKRWIGRRTNASDNAARDAYNRRMRAEYGGKDRAPLFDLALIEAADSKGSATAHSVGNENYYSLRPEYTDDGGHLNKTGRHHVAERLVVALAKIFR